MRKFSIAVAIILLISCKDKTTNLSKDVAIKPNQFIAAFKPIEGVFAANDTNIYSLADTVSINHNLLSRFVPDSVVNRLIDGNKKTVFHPIGRISKTSDTYILVLTIKNKKPFLSTLVFDKENKYLASKDLFSPHTDAEGYKYNLTINKEPTFFINREKVLSDKEVRFTKIGWAFNGKNFVSVVKESNERSDKLIKITNPIEALGSENKYSGDYVQDDRNFISIRDGKNKLDYLFFLNIDKNEGTCIGELKGEMQLTDSTHAVYNFAGDPCVIDFSFDRNNIIIKEKGSCGNRRGMDCYFDDAYTKRKEVKKKLPKTSLVSIATPIILPTKTVAPFKLAIPKTPIKSVVAKKKVVAKPVQKSTVKPEENPYGN